MRSARTTLALTSVALFFAALIVARPSSGQQTIDLFEGQDKMSSRPIAVESTDGQPSTSGGDDWDGSATTRVDGGVTLHYEQFGPGLLVPAQVEGRSVYFLFDTGATTTTLTTEFARAAGIAPRKDYPTATTQTANGPREIQFGIIRTLSLGGRNHYGVTFGTCDACPTGTHKGKPIVGLLGLNVLGRYHASFDDSRGQIELSPGVQYSNRIRDIQPWLAVELKYREDSKDTLGMVEFHNRSPRKIKDLSFRFSCPNGNSADKKVSLTPRSKKEVSAVIKSRCGAQLDFSIQSASW